MLVNSYNISKTLNAYNSKCHLWTYALLALRSSIALCMVSQPLNRKITKMVLCVSLHLNSYLENYFMKIISVAIRYINEGTLCKTLYQIAPYLSLFFGAHFFWDTWYWKVFDSLNTIQYIMTRYSKNREF